MTQTPAGLVIPEDPFGDGLHRFGDRLRVGQVSIHGALSACLARAALLNPTLGAYVQVLSSSALAQASHLDSLLQQRIDLGPLMGVPVAVKENFYVNGADCRGGTPVDVSDILAFEGEFIAALRRAGAIVIGITAMCELAMGGVGINLFRGTTRNPWDSRVARACGGSSNGSAAAVAAGLCGFAVGTDTGGSVRSPAAFTGVVGYKPTQSLWSRDGVLPLSESFDAIGTLARSVEDTRLICSVLATAVVSPVWTSARWRIGYAFDEFERCSPQVRQAIDRATVQLRRLGAEFVPLSMPPAPSVDAFYEHRLRREFFSVYGQGRFDIEPRLANPDVAGRIARMRQENNTEPGHESLDTMSIAESIFSQCDVLMQPTKFHLAPTLPQRGDAQALLNTAELCKGPTRLANVLGLCAISLPVLEPASGLPVGLQFSCAPGNDDRLLDFAGHAESAIGVMAAAPVGQFLRAAQVGVTRRWQSPDPTHRTSEEGHAH